LINGRIFEKFPGSTRNSELAGLVSVEVRLFCRAVGITCHTCGGNGALQIGENVLVPDFAYKQTPMSSDYPDPVAPLWVVEVISPNDQPLDIRAKRQVYLQAGILYWELYPEDRSVDVFAPGLPMRTYRAGDAIDLGDLIPGFKLILSELFE
jgi:Uma2 family endonuclease